MVAFVLPFLGAMVNFSLEIGEVAFDARRRNTGDGDAELKTRRWANKRMGYFTLGYSPSVTACIKASVDSM